MASKIGKLIGYGGSSRHKPMDSAAMMEAEEHEEDNTDESSGDVSDSDDDGAHVLAMKSFMKASTPEAKADAMRSFIEACKSY